MKVADVRLFWKKSPSADVEKVIAKVTIDGTETVTEFGPDPESMMIVVHANGSVSFLIETVDSEGMVSTSESYAFSLGDLEAPLPATDLGHEITGIRDEEE